MYYYKEFSQCDGYLIYAKTDIHISVNKNWKNIFPLGDIQKSRDAGEGERGGGHHDLSRPKVEGFSKRHVTK